MNYPLLIFKDEIIKSIEKFEKIPKGKIELERPPEEKGDFALPCFQLSSILKSDPKSIAEDLSTKIKLNHGKVYPDGPYLNFYIDKVFLTKKTLKECFSKKDDYGKLPKKEIKVLIEHTSANPTGPLHVGRARNPIIGDTIARVYEKLGYDIERQYYVNDIGRQMAMLTWGIENIDEKQLNSPTRDKKDHDYVRYYQKVNQILENDKGLEEEIREIIRSMERGDKRIFKALKKNSETVLSGIMKSLKRLNIVIDSCKHESSFIEDGSVKEVIKRISKLDKSYEDDGAMYYKIEDDKDIYVTREDGTNLYPARDLAYHIWKGKNADKLINILGEDHKTHGDFMLDILNALNVSPIPEIIFHSFVSFEGKEMSTRKGEYVDIDEFMDTAVMKAREEINKRRNDLTKKDTNKIAKKVGISSVRYNIIKVQPSKPIDFKWEEALNFQGNSAPFIQYSYARAQGILEKLDDEITLYNSDFENWSEGENDLIKKIAEFPIILFKVKKNNAPHQLAQYAQELAAEFNQFYRDYPVLDAEDDEQKKKRISIVKGFTHCMASVFDTLGIEKTKKM